MHRCVASAHLTNTVVKVQERDVFCFPSTNMYEISLSPIITSTGIILVLLELYSIDILQSALSDL